MQSSSVIQGLDLVEGGWFWRSLCLGSSPLRIQAVLAVDNQWLLNVSDWRYVPVLERTSERCYCGAAARVWVAWFSEQSWLPHKAHYGLKQATWWNVCIGMLLIGSRYRNLNNANLCNIKEEDGKQTIIILYVDNVILTGDHGWFLEKINGSLHALN